MADDNENGPNGNGASTFDGLMAEPPPGAPIPAPALHIVIDNDDPSDDPDITKLPDGGLLINLTRENVKKDPTGAKRHDANLADYIEDMELARISDELLDGINADIESRREWIERRAQGIKHLALNIENPRSPSADADTAVDGQATVRTPILLDAVLRFQANAGGELLPADGPVKVANMASTPTPTMQKTLNAMGTPPDQGDVRAEALEKDMNYYLTVTDGEYYPDTDRMLFMTGFGGSGFKKIYDCPIKRRPVSRAADADDIIVSDNEVSLHDCGRVTHRILMRQSVLKRMQLSEMYRDIDVMTPTAPDMDALQSAEHDAAGIAIWTQRPDDYKHTIYECYCELDIAGFEHKQSGGFTGLPLPYRVSIDKDSQEILEIRRNWREGDELYLKHMPIVKFPFVAGLGFYGIGLLAIMGNATAAITTAWRLALDAAAFASWPGFLYSEVVGRQDTMDFKIGLGAGKRVNTGGQDLKNHVMPLPYKDPTQGLFQIMGKMEEEGRRVGGTPELMVGEGRQDVPVGTTLAMIDQAIKVINAVHRRLHVAQAQEFRLLRDLFRKNPRALICANPNPARAWEEIELKQALEDCNISPQADPNTSSHTIRVMKAVALVQIVMMKPDEFDFREVCDRVSSMVGLGDMAPLYSDKSNQPQTDPKALEAMGKVQTKMAELAQKSEQFQKTQLLEMMQMELDRAMSELTALDHRENRLSQERIAGAKIMQERMQLAQGALVHEAAIPAAQQFVAGWPTSPGGLGGGGNGGGRPNGGGRVI